MAENKKSFILYCDQKGVWDKLNEEQAGRLIKHVLAYVNDEDPKAPDFITELAFEPIKQSLKRDLKRWEVQQEQRRAAGRKSAKVRKDNATSVNGRSTETNKRSASSTDNVNVNVNVNDNVNVNVNDNAKRDREVKFREQVAQHTQYSKKMLDKFCDYWTESKPKGRKLRYEMQKVFDIKRRLVTWKSNEGTDKDLSPVDAAMYNLNNNVNKQLNDYDI